MKPRTTIERTTSRRTIFLVEPWRPLLELLELHLLEQGYNVKSFVNHNTALEAFSTAQPRPGLLITNYGVGASGVDLMGMCTQTEPSLKTILCSGCAEIPERIPASPSRFRFIPKPFPLAILDFNVQSLIGKSSE